MDLVNILALPAAFLGQHCQDVSDTPSSDAEAPPRISWWQIIAVGRNPKVTAVRLVLLAVLTYFGFQYFFVGVRVEGVSMAPTHPHGQRVFLRRLHSNSRPLERGDVVGIRYAGERVLLIKRIIALPGERLRIRNGTVFVDDVPLKEPYLKNPAPWNYPETGRETVVGPDEFFVIGDNRTMRVEDHYFGVATRDRILGRVGK